MHNQIYARQRTVHHQDSCYINEEILSNMLDEILSIELLQFMMPISIGTISPSRNLVWFMKNIFAGGLKCVINLLK